MFKYTRLFINYDGNEFKQINHSNQINHVRDVGLYFNDSSISINIYDPTPKHRQHNASLKGLYLFNNN